jgi:hypothetical protein
MRSVSMVFCPSFGRTMYHFIFSCDARFGTVDSYSSANDSANDLSRFDVCGGSSFWSVSEML